MWYVGEMNPSDAAKTILDKKNRTLIRFTIEDAAEVTETIVKLLGKDTTYRKKFITDGEL